jgi:hypothetical protein
VGSVREEKGRRKKSKWAKKSTKRTLCFFNVLPLRRVGKYAR